MLASALVTSTCLSFAKRERFYPQPDRIYRISHGIARTCSLDSDGNLVVLGFWGINDLLGQPLSRIEFYQIESLTPLEMRAISPVHMYSEVTNLIAHGQQIEELFWIQRHRTLETRLRCFLRWLDLKFGREIDIGRLIDLPLSHQQIAETIGSTRVTITRLIRRLVQQDILQQHYRRLIILDRERI